MGYSYSYDSDFMEALGGEEFFAALAGIFLFAIIIGLVFALILYIIKSIGLSTIAKRRGIGNAWLAWFPIGSEWIAGSISDQYRSTARNQVTNRRFVLLVVALISVALSIASSALSSGTVEILAEAIIDEDPEAIMEALVGLLGGAGLIGTLSSILTFLATVFWYVAMADLYSSCCPKNDVLMLVLSFMMPILEPFFIFCNRNKDAGMIPANPQPQQPVWQDPQPVAPQWQQPEQPQWQPVDPQPGPWDNN